MPLPAEIVQTLDALDREAASPAELWVIDEPVPGGHAFVCQALHHRDVTLMNNILHQCRPIDIRLGPTAVTSDYSKLMLSPCQMVKSVQLLSSHHVAVGAYSVVA